jgi:hypothetical protein
MLLLALVACYEAVIVDARVDARHGTVHLVVRQQGLDPQVGETACTTADACLTAIRAQLARDREELTDYGATSVVNGVVLRDGELDLVSVYDAPLTARLFDTGSLLLRAPTEDQRGPQRAVAVLVQPPDDTQHRTVIRVDGRYRRYAIPDVGTVWTLDRGHPQVHLEYHLLADAGGDIVVEPWVAGVAGLDEGIRQGGLLLDPALLPG